MATLSPTPEIDGNYKYGFIPTEGNTTEQLNRARVHFILNKPPPLNDIRKTCTHKNRIVCIEEGSDTNIMAADKTLGIGPSAACDNGCDTVTCTGLRQLRLVNKLNGNKRAETKHLCNCRGLRTLILVDRFKEANSGCGASKEGCRKF
ncbi:uncharacterized protein H6S33_007858 [Morchella sextelata]|uniref:uncharacterized protein n=1 Tax=Morchella sextelata TaxID=1174677 RepID=UPI001D05BB15|nr:uncharacterized protein H6S33_007858 [Morchella sextelata]KAH0603536.1 hypothetical protein H6S33_007858 [Morchella sextelata]